MNEWQHDRIGSAERGENPTVLMKLPSGYAVMGDTQFLPGYCVLLAAPSVMQLNDLPIAQRQRFLLDMSLLGEAIEHACHSNGLLRMNYEILGNTDAYLHAHVFPRYTWEPIEHRLHPVWLYPHTMWTDKEHLYTQVHHPLKATIQQELRRLVQPSQ